MWGVGRVGGERADGGEKVEGSTREEGGALRDVLD